MSDTEPNNDGIIINRNGLSLQPGDWVCIDGLTTRVVSVVNRTTVTYRYLRWHERQWLNFRTWLKRVLQR